MKDARSKVALGVDQDCVILCATPVSHLGGFVAGVILPAFLGARSVIMPGWRPDEAVELIEAEQASLAMGATVFLSDLVQRYEAGAAQKHRLTLYACAGATLPPSLVLRAEAAGVRAMRCYGMTETAGVCAAAPPDAPVGRRSQWDGQVLAGMEIQAVTPDRVPLPPGEEGERGGEKFSALDIESAIASHPDVAAVTAIPDERLGEAVGAWIVLTPGTEWHGPAALTEHLEAARLARQKLPVRWTVVPALPATASGKIQKNKLAEWDRPS